jgi:hypothetical protein
VQAGAGLRPPGEKDRTRGMLLRHVNAGASPFDTIDSSVGAPGGSSKPPE